MFRLLLAALLLFAPLASAQAPEGAIDATITLSPEFGPIVDGPTGLLTIEEIEDGERYEFNLTLTKDYTTFEVRANGFDITRPKQIVPTLDLPDTEYPLFEPFPNEEIWDVDSAATVYFTNGTKDAVILRLGITGPRNVTLVIARDVTPPSFEAGPVQDIKTYGFYQEFNASEIAIGDLQVRKSGATEWVVNPTPVFHFRHRFPIQGLDPDAEYEARYTVTDWAGNANTSEIYRVRSAPRPFAADIIITPISPAPNATIMPGSVSIRASIQSPGAAIPADGIRVFFDLKEVTEGIDLQPGEVVWTPTGVLTPGIHRVSIEATNEAGGKGLARWSFEVEGAARTKDTPFPFALSLAVVALVLLSLRRR